ncbi:MAG: YkgJ family cysteine cluster protein [Limisphaerales bacterium]
MKSLRVEIPLIQNWSCHGCSDCCRGHLLIQLLPEDKQRIEKQGWTMADGVDPGSMIVAEGGRFRLGHQKDGACVFLDPSGRCRIHAKYGEEAKPLACRLYPLVIHPAGQKVVVGLRFSCPSAALNHGQPLAEQKAEIQKLAEYVALEHFREIPPPAVLAGPGAEWPDLLRFVKWLDTSMSVKEAPLTLRFLRTLYWLGAVERGSFSQISGPGADDILKALFDGAANKLPVLPESPPSAGWFSRLFFRLLVLEYARAITVEDLLAPGRYRWKILGAAWRFARGGGRTPALREGLESVEFAAIEQRFEPLSPAIEAMLTRFFRVKIQSLHFCGRAFHDRPLIEGFRNLTLLYPVILWLGRWLAAGQQRTNLTEADVARAISMVDYHYSYSPYLAWRVRLLAQRDDIARLCAWYGR